MCYIFDKKKKVAPSGPASEIQRRAMWVFTFSKSSLVEIILFLQSHLLGDNISFMHMSK